VFLAAKPSGGRTLGVRRALNARTLRDHLKAERKVLLSSWAVPGSAAPETGSMRLKDRAEFHMQMSQLLSRGVPLTEALEVCITSVSERVRPTIVRLRDLVAAGSSFGDACQQVGCFDPVTISVYRAAERSGDLAGAAKQLSQTARRELAVVGKAATLLIYPAIVVIISIFVVAAMMLFIVPRIAEYLIKSNVPLSLYSQVIFGTSIFLSKHLMGVAVGVMVLVALAIILRKELMRLGLRLIRMLPIVRSLLVAQDSARFFTVMAAMSRTGVNLADALAIATAVVNEANLRAQLTRLRTKLIEGGVLRQLIEDVTALPVGARRLLIAGERSGDLSTTFDTLAADLTEEVDRKSQRLLALLEPLLIVAMFFVIASLLLSIMIPLLQASQSRPV
jgi:general secretion pathway protein F